MSEGDGEKLLPPKNLVGRISKRLGFSKAKPVSDQTSGVNEKGRRDSNSLQIKIQTREESEQVSFEDVVEHVDLPDKEMAIESVAISQDRAGILVEGWENVASTLTRYSGFGEGVEREQWEIDFFQKVLDSAKSSVERSGRFEEYFDRTETAFHKAGLEVKKLKGDGNKYILRINQAYVGNAGEQRFARTINAKTGLYGVDVKILLKPYNNRVFVNFEEVRSKIIQALGSDGLVEEPDDRIVDKLKGGTERTLRRGFSGGRTKDGIGLVILLENCIEEDYSIIRQVGKIQIGDNRIDAPQDIDYDRLRSKYAYMPSILRVKILPDVGLTPSELPKYKEVDLRVERLDNMAFDEDMQSKLLAAANKVKAVFEVVGTGTSQ